MIRKELKNKKIALLGLGIEGISSVKYFLKHDIDFTIIDEKSSEALQDQGKEWKEVLEQVKKEAKDTMLGEPFSEDVLKNFDIIIRSPGISMKKSYLQGFSGIITSQTKLFFDWAPGKIIGVTGTKGKGTTSSLIYEMLRLSGKDAYLGGNIGKAPFDFLDDLSDRSYTVLELSSFQLQDAEKSPHIGVMLMVTQEHVDYHGSIEEYQESKRNIFRFQTADDMAILNTDYEATAQSGKGIPAKVVWVSRFQPVENGCFVLNNEVVLREDGMEKRIIATSDIRIPGQHNLENVCPAVMAAHACGVDVGIMQEVLKTFAGLEHRLELVREVNGVKYYDDSIATNPESAIAALQAFSAPKVVILGGLTEGSDFTSLGKYISEDTSIKAIIGIGRDWPEIKKLINDEESRIKLIEGMITMKEVVHEAQQLAVSGDIILLSPACKSFDMFKSYKDRGAQFKNEVNLL